MIRLLFAVLLLVSAGAAAEPKPAAPRPDDAERPAPRKPVPLAPEAFADFVGRYEREETTILVFRDQGHFFIKVNDRDRVEIFALSDHEFFAEASPDTLSFERDDRGRVTHFIRRSAPPQLYRRVR